MKCPNCGAEIGESKFCEFCGTQISLEMKKEQEQLNKKGCPKCGSSNIKFTRENHGEVRGKNAKQIVHRTVGFCQDCGHTWYPESAANDAPKKKNTIWWVLGWIFFFPAPVMVLIWRKKNTWDIKVKIAVTAAFWILFYIIGSINNNKTTNEVPQAAVIEQSETEASTDTKNVATNVESTTDSVQAESQSADFSIETKEEDYVSKEFKSALKKASAYANSMYMSKQAVYDQLTSEYGEKFPADAAQYAIDNVECDWKENALKKAENYSDTMYMSKLAIYDQLISEYGERFTEEEAQYAIDNIKADWKANALEKAKTYQDSMSMSSSAIYDQLTSEYGERFTAEEAQYAVDHLE